MTDEKKKENESEKRRRRKKIFFAKVRRITDNTENNSTQLVRTHRMQIEKKKNTDLYMKRNIAVKKKRTAMNRN